VEDDTKLDDDDVWEVHPDGSTTKFNAGVARSACAGGGGGGVARSACASGGGGGSKGSDIDDDEPFAGASGATMQGVNPHRCENCLETYFEWSMFAYLNKDGSWAKEVSIHLHAALTLAKTGQQTQVNQAQPHRDVIFSCAFCCAAAHEVPNSKYVTTAIVKDDDGKEKFVFKPTSFFRNRRRETMGRPATDKRSKRIAQMCDQRLERIEKEGPQGPRVSAAAVYEALRANAMLLSALDWMTPIGSNILWLLYGCIFCKLAPTMSNCWYRFARPGFEQTAGTTTAGDKHGYWKCANCCKKWTWADSGAFRLMVIGDYHPGHGFTDYELAFIGQVSDTINNTINWLKGIAALQWLGGRRVTRELCLQMISDMNKKANLQLSKGIKECRYTTSIDPDSQVDFVTNSSLFCEDERLSLRGAGYKYRVIDTTLYPGGVKTITDAALKHVLETAAASLNVEEWHPTTKAQREFKWGLEQSEGFRAGRQWLRAHL
jgi:hypothetical protein